MLKSYFFIDCYLVYYLMQVDATNNDPNQLAPLNDPHGWSGYAGIRVGDFKLVLGYLNNMNTKSSIFSIFQN